MLTAASLSLHTTSASAAEPCQPTTEYTDGHDGSFAWCEHGEGFIRAKVGCVAESTFRKYTVVGTDRVYSKKFHGRYIVGAWCRGIDAAYSKGYVLG